MASLFEPDRLMRGFANMVGSAQQNQWQQQNRRGWNQTYTPTWNTTTSNGVATGSHQINGVAAGWGSPVSGNNVYGALGAGAAPGTGRFATNSPTAQLADHTQANAQRQAELAQAAQMRGTNTPGGMDAWHNNMMQGLARMGGMQAMASPQGQQMQAAYMRATPTPGGIEQWRNSWQGR